MFGEPSALIASTGTHSSEKLKFPDPGRVTSLARIGYVAESAFNIDASGFLRGGYRRGIGPDADEG